MPPDTSCSQATASSKRRRVDAPPRSHRPEHAPAQGCPDPREMEAEITALRRRVRELEKENEFLGKANAFFASVHHNTSALN